MNPNISSLKYYLSVICLLYQLKLIILTSINDTRTSNILFAIIFLFFLISQSKKKRNNFLLLLIGSFFFKSTSTCDCLVIGNPKKTNSQI